MGWLSELSERRDGSVVVLVRNVPRHSGQDSTPMTVSELAEAGEFGAALRGHGAVVRSAPKWRSVDTATAIREGAGLPVPSSCDVGFDDRLLGDPSIFVLRDREQEALQSWIRFDGKLGVYGQLLGKATVPGWHEAPEQAAQDLVRHCRRVADQSPGRVGVFVTYDFVMMMVAGVLLGIPIPGHEWPQYLETVVIYWKGTRQEPWLTYRGHEAPVIL